MANWKKLIYSGSDAHIRNLSASNATISDKVGIGTDTPKATLQVKNTTAHTLGEDDYSTDSIALYGGVGNAESQSFGAITWHNDGRRRASIASVMEHSDADHVGIAFSTHGTDGPGDFAESMRLSRNGRLGIGNKRPTTRLTVEGDISASGDLYVRHAYVSGALSIEGFPDVSASLAEVVSEDSAITAATASTINVTDMLDDENSAYYITAVKSIGAGQPLKGHDLLQWNPSQSKLTIQNNDHNKITSVDIRGTGQGTGRLYVGQDASYGGGIIYQGDSAPATMSNTPADDWTGLFRRNAGVSNFVAGYKYNSDNFYFVGQVGIGTTTPTKKLTVQGSISASGNIHLDGTQIQLDGNASIILDNTNNNNAYYIRNGGTNASTFQIGLGDTPGSDIVMTMDGNENVGIGTPSRGEKLEVAGNLKLSGSAATQKLMAYHSDGEYGIYAGYGIELSRATSYIRPITTDHSTLEIGMSAQRWANVEFDASYFKILNGGAEKMRVDANGNVGIGTTNPATELDLYGKLSINSHKILDLSNNNLTRGPFNPIIAAIRNSGKCLALDTDFADDQNGITVYNSGNTPSVTVQRLQWNKSYSSEGINADLDTNWADLLFTGTAAGYGESNVHSLGVPNSTGLVIRIHYNAAIGGTAASVHPDLGGFRQPVAVVEMNHTYVHVFKALLPVGFELMHYSGHTGADVTEYWLTSKEGTGKWEWYAHASHIGSKDSNATSADDVNFNFGGGIGYFTLKNSTAAIYGDDQNWFLASSTIYDMTEADAFTHRQIGIGTISPGSELEVIGDISASGTIQSNTVSASHLHIDDDLTVEGDIGIGGSIFGLSGFGVTIDDVAVTSGSTNFGSGSLPSNNIHKFTGSVSITGSDLTWNGNTVLTSAELHWTDTGTEITASKAVGISGSLRVLGPITASELAIIPHEGFSTGTELINFGYSSSVAEGGTFDFFPRLLLGGTVGNSFIGRQNNLDSSNLPANGIKFEGSAEDFALQLGNVGINGTNKIAIFDTSLASRGIEYRATKHVFGEGNPEGTGKTLLQITSSVASFRTDVQISASLYVSESVEAVSFTGSLLGNVEGTASRAVTASYADNVDVFPFIGQAVITGSLIFRKTGSLPLGNLSGDEGTGLFEHVTLTPLPSSTTRDDEDHSFDGDLDTFNYWETVSGDTANGIKIDYAVAAKLGYAPTINKFRYISHTFNDPGFNATSFQISGSMDGTNWTGIFREPETTNTWNGEYFERTTVFQNSTAYNHYRAHVPAANTGSLGVLVRELEYFEASLVSADHFIGTGSYSEFAESALSASYAMSGSHAATAVSASHGITSVSASHAVRSVSASHAITSVSASHGITSVSASHAVRSVSASYATSASAALYAVTASHALNGAVFPFTGDAVITGSLNVVTSVPGITPTSELLPLNDLTLSTVDTYVTMGGPVPNQKGASHGSNNAPFTLFDDSTTLPSTVYYWYWSEESNFSDDVTVDYAVADKLGYAPVITEIFLKFHSDNYACNKVIISAKNNGDAGFTELHDETPVSDTGANQRTITFDNSLAYDIYRVTYVRGSGTGTSVTNTWGANGLYPHEIRYFGYQPTILPINENVTILHGDISASGNISASGDLHIFGGKVRIKDELNVYSSGDTAADPKEGHILRVTTPNDDAPIIEHFFAESDDELKGFSWRMDGSSGKHDFSLYRHDGAGGVEITSQVFKVQRGSDDVEFNGSIKVANNIGNLVTGVSGQVLEDGDSTVTTLRFDSDRWRVWAGGSERLTVESGSGHVGIGTSNPSKELEVIGDISASGNLFAGLTEDTNNTDTYKTVMYDNLTGRFYYTGSYGGGGGTGGTDLTSLPEINGNNPVVTHLAVIGDDDAAAQIDIGNVDLSLFNNDISQMGDFTIPLYITHQADPDTKFGFTNNDQFNVIAGGTEKLRVNSSGDLHIKNDIIGFSTTVSDKRLKTDIQLLTGSLDTICKLEGVRYNWKYRNDAPQLGVIAQQVEQYVPEIVKEMKLPLHASDDNLYKTVQYEQLIPHLIESIKELRAELEEVKRQLKE